MSQHGHSWRHLVDDEVACRHCGAQPFSVTGREPCPVTNYTPEQPPSVNAGNTESEGAHLHVDDIETCSCGHPHCVTLQGIGLAYVQLLSDWLDEGHDYGMAWAEVIDRMETLTLAHWAALNDKLGLE